VGSDTSNTPLEWTGPRQRSDSAPQDPCLPLRGSVGPQDAAMSTIEPLQPFGSPRRDDEPCESKLPIRERASNRRSMVAHWRKARARVTQTPLLADTRTFQADSAADVNVVL
jgi:hypothetical protein